MKGYPSSHLDGSPLKGSPLKGLPFKPPLAGFSLKEGEEEEGFKEGEGEGGHEGEALKGEPSRVRRSFKGNPPKVRSEQCLRPGLNSWQPLALECLQRVGVLGGC